MIEGYVPVCKHGAPIWGYLIADTRKEAWDWVRQNSGNRNKKDLEALGWRVVKVREVEG